MKMLTLFLIIILFYNISFAKWTIIDNTVLKLNDKIRNFYLDNKDNIWIGTSSPLGIYKFDGEKTIYYDTSNTPLPFTQINCITQGPNGDMYFGTGEDYTSPQMTSLIRYDGENWEYFNQFNSPMHPYTIWNILATGDDEFWMATVIGLFHYKNGKWNSYFEDENEYRREIRSIAIDKDNNLYITNALSELYSANVEINNFKFKKISTLSTGITVSGSCFIDSLNNLWLEIRDQLHKRINNNWVVYDSTNFENETHNFSFLIDNEGKMYINTNKGVFEYKENSYWEKILVTPDSVLGGLISLKAKDSRGNFWFTSGNTLVKYTPESNSVKKETNVKIYPNPSQNTIIINAEEPITKLTLYTMNLSKISEYPANHTTTQEINISSIPVGIYFIKVNDNFIKFVRE